MNRLIACWMLLSTAFASTSAFAKPKMIVELIAKSYSDSSGLSDRIFLILPDGSHATAECWLGMHISCGIDAFKPEKRITKSCHSTQEPIATCYVGEAYYANRKGNDLTIYAANGERTYHITGSWDAFEDNHIPSLANSGESGQGTAPVQGTAAAESIVKLQDQAARGDAIAQYILGLDYSTGKGVPQDDTQAVYWLRKAAFQGNVDAQFSLGAHFDNGLGVPQDHAEAAIWYRKGAEHGDADSQYILGWAYDIGQGVPQDYAEAYFWLDLAAAGKIEKGHENLVKLRDDASSHLTRTDLFLAQERARKWFEDHPAKPQ